MAEPLCVCGCVRSEHRRGRDACNGTARTPGGRLWHCPCKGYREAIAQLDREPSEEKKGDDTTDRSGDAR